MTHDSTRSGCIRGRALSIRLKQHVMGTSGCHAGSTGVALLGGAGRGRKVQDASSIWPSIYGVSSLGLEGQVCLHRITSPHGQFVLVSCAKVKAPNDLAL